MVAPPDLDPRTPILVGVGTAVRPVGSAPPPLEPLELMVEAARAALRDAGGSTAIAAGLIDRLGSVAVPVGNWSYADPGRLVAEHLGASSARSIRVEVGVSQQTPVRVAWESIRRGELDVALVVGGEAKATAQARSRAGLENPETDQGDAVPDQTWAPEGEIVSAAEIEAGMWQAVEHYACIENALRAADGIDLDTQLDQIVELWSRFAAVAARFPDAAFPGPHDPAVLRAAGPTNRLLAFPYAKWHSTQWAVDQAAALLLCSVGTAIELGIPEDRWVFPSVLVESSASVPLSCRTEPHRWPAMELLGRAAADHLGHPLAEVPLVELYSCFPAAVRVQQRELGLPADGTPTLTGGMAFAGGPFNNFSYQATAAVVAALRDDPDAASALVTTVSGLLTKPALAVWSTRPDPEPLVADLGDQVERATVRLASVARHAGEGTVVTYTLTTDGSSPTESSQAFVIADVDQGTRWIGRSDDPALVAAGSTGGLIGDRVVVEGDRCRLVTAD